MSRMAVVRRLSTSNRTRFLPTFNLLESIHMNNIKEKIKETYGSIAIQQSKLSCCDSSCSSDEFVNSNYNIEELGKLHIADLGLGCGNPAAYSEMREGMTVVDLGSGAGIDVFIASQHVGTTGNVIGVDMTEQMILRARENALNLGIANVEFRLGDIEHMPIDPETVDLIMSNCVINLVPDKLRAFTEMYRVLKKNGSFIISDMVTTGIMPLEMKNNPESWTSCVAGALDKAAYLDVIAQAGFHDVQILKEKKYERNSTPTFGLYSMTIKGLK